MLAATNIAPVDASVQSAKALRQRKLLLASPEVVIYLLKKFAGDQEIAEMNAKILRYTQPFSKTSMQSVDDLYSKLYKVADVYDESSLKDTFTEDVDVSICHSLCEYRVSNPQADLNDIVFKAQSLLAIQEESTKPPHAAN